MKTRSQNICGIVCRVVNKGRLPQVSRTRMGSKYVPLDWEPFEKHSDGNHAQGNPPAGTATKRKKPKAKNGAEMIVKKL